MPTLARITLHLPMPQVQLLEQLITRLASRPGEAAKLRKSKQQLKKRMEPALSSLVHWRAGGYVGFDQLPQEVQRLASAAHDWTLGKIRLLNAFIFLCPCALHSPIEPARVLRCGRQACSTLCFYWSTL